MQINKTKLTLSHKELELVCNADWILTKQAIIQKVYQLLGETCLQMQQFIELHLQELPGEITTKPPKISKGENYKGLPYVMLDYPRCFDERDTMAIRTMFWWGNFFSVSLQLSGRYRATLEPALLKSCPFFQQHEYWICINDTAWEHHFENDNFRLIKELSEKEFSSILQEGSFVKIAKKIPLQQWETVPGFIKNTFENMIEILSAKPVK